MQLSTNTGERIIKLINDLDDSRRKLASLEGKEAALQEQLNRYEDQVQQCESLDLSYQKLAKFFQTMGTEEQQRLQHWFEKVVTYGLNSVFGEGVYRFSISGPEVKGAEIALGFDVVERIDGMDYSRDPYNEMGGGIADVLAFLLQFIMVFLLRDRINPIIFIDEAMKHLAVEYRGRMANLMWELADKTGVQIVMVTHDVVFVEAADTAYEFTKPNLETLVERIK
jgi:DNA repair exonuclease SbcCD ATPase subunit